MDDLFDGADGMGCRVKFYDVIIMKDLINDVIFIIPTNSKERSKIDDGSEFTRGYISKSNSSVYM